MELLWRDKQFTLAIVLPLQLTVNSSCLIRIYHFQLSASYLLLKVPHDLHYDSLLWLYHTLLIYPFPKMQAEYKQIRAEEGI